MYFRLFFDLVTANPDALFTLLYPSAKDGGEVLFDDDSVHPIQVVLEGAGGEVQTLQLLFFSWEEEIVHRCEVQ
jgi:hypothetical protein